MLSDGEIANAATLKPISEIASSMARHRRRLGPGALRARQGQDRPRVHRSLADRPDGKLVLVTAISPTPAGEGKTTTTVGLVDALRRIGQRSCGALREPSMGPVFGMKGGAAGGGYSQVVPMTDINLHFTGDFAAIAAANNLLSALIDNHVHHGNALDIDVRSITWKRVVDLNDRALRQTGRRDGRHRQRLPARGRLRHRRRVGADGDLLPVRVAVRPQAPDRPHRGRAHRGTKQPITAADLGAEGALAVLLKNALAPNLVQTLEHSPVFVHGGPFANIAHGCNSVIATRTALKLADIVVTEAGFGSDLGAEKFIDIKCRKSGLRPDAVVVVATVRALKFHGGVAVPDLQKEDVDALRRGFVNIERHLTNLRDVFGLPAVVAINRFPSDTDAEIQVLRDLTQALGFQAFPATHFVDGGAGAEALAWGVLDELKEGAPTSGSPTPTSGRSRRRPPRWRPSCTAPPGSTSPRRPASSWPRSSPTGSRTCPCAWRRRSTPSPPTPRQSAHRPGHTIDVREVRLSAGAGFIVLVTGDIMTMPGLPKVPASAHIDVDDDGVVTGLS